MLIEFYKKRILELIEDMENGKDDIKVVKTYVNLYIDMIKANMEMEQFKEDNK